MTAKILITGATGNNGKEILRLLSEKGIATRAMARSLSKATQLPDVEWVEGDFSDKTSLINAMQGIERAFIVTAISPEHVQWHQNFYDAAKQAGVKHIVKFSGFGASTSSTSEIIRHHGESDQLLKDSGLTYTILQPNSFFQNILGSLATINSQNAFYMPLKNAKQSLIDVRDIAEVAVAALTESGHENKVYRLSGAESLSFGEVAKILSDNTNRDIQYVDVPPEAAKQGMMDAGMPEWHATALAEILSLFAEGAYAETTNDVEQVTGHAPRTFNKFVQDHISLFH